MKRDIHQITFTLPSPNQLHPLSLMDKCEHIITETPCQLYQLRKFHMNVQINIIGSSCYDILHPSTYIFGSFGIFYKSLPPLVLRHIFCFCPTCYFPYRPDTLCWMSHVCLKDKVCTACHQPVPTV